MRETPPINFKEIPLVFKIGLIVAFFALPLPFFIFVVLFGLYYVFYISAKKHVGSSPSEDQPVSSIEEIFQREKAKEDLYLPTYAKPAVKTSQNAVICPQCESRFTNGKPQVCHLSNCYYDK